MVGWVRGPRQDFSDIRVLGPVWGRLAGVGGGGRKGGGRGVGGGGGREAEGRGEMGW